jgi:hypothetical protein
LYASVHISLIVKTTVDKILVPVGSTRERLNSYICGATVSGQGNDDCLLIAFGQEGVGYSRCAGCGSFEGRVEERYFKG